MDETTSIEQENTLAQLNELILDHLGIPRPGTGSHIQELQDQLLPAFMESAQYAWLAASPYQVPQTTNDPAKLLLKYLHDATEVNALRIKKLNEVLEVLGVQELLNDVAVSPQASSLSQIKMDLYEARLLQAIGHPNPKEAVLKYLLLAAQNPKLFSDLEETLQKAEQASLSAHKDITNIIKINVRPQPPPKQAAPVAKRPKRRNLFSGLGTLFSGLALVAGNSIFIPSIPMTGATAIPIIGSIAAGLAATGEGIGKLWGEGEVPELAEQQAEKRPLGSS